MGSIGTSMRKVAGSNPDELLGVDCHEEVNIGSFPGPEWYIINNSLKILSILIIWLY